MDKSNNKQFADNLGVIFNLEWLGIRIEDVKEEKERYGFLAKTAYYFSVPESSVIELDDKELIELGDKELNGRIKTSDGLILLAKERLTNMLINSCREAYPDDEEFIDDVKTIVSEYFKFYAKVRTGEVWSREMGDNRIKELCKDIQQAAQYKEV